MSHIISSRQRIPLRRLVMSSLILGSGITGLIVGQSAGAGSSQVVGPVVEVSNVKTGLADGIDAFETQCVRADSDPEPEFVDMPGMTTTFSFGGNAPRTVIVMFQAEWSIPSFSAVFRVKIDDVIHPDPIEDPIGLRQSASGLGGFNFISQRLTPGPHTVTVQFARYGPEFEGPACVDERSLLIFHK